MPARVASGPWHVGIAAVWGGMKEAGMGKTFIERNSLSFRGQNM